MFDMSATASDTRYLPSFAPLREAPAPRKPASWEDTARRGLDITLALIGLVVVAPLLVATAILIKLQDGGPIFFSQPRMGLGGATFKCWKFRSMVVDAQARLDELLARDPEARAEWAKNQKLKVDPRITALGAFLRKSSVDELPQLLNVLAGEMSIVGPRPIIRAEVSRYANRFYDYCRVKPGLTGLWQVSGRSTTTYRRRVAMDTLYVRRRTLMMDLKIIVATIPAVLQSRGSY